MSVGTASIGGGPTSSTGCSTAGSGGGGVLILTVICAYPNDADRQTQTKTKIFTKFFILLPLSF
jgi:hypothetical protein